MLQWAIYKMERLRMIIYIHHSSATIYLQPHVQTLKIQVILKKMCLAKRKKNT